ncbi:hypothetical protein SDC9_168267 [bioreactor metagenome]|uniref:Uncharacterized protein n=1 Tax=bioreactor metagenome TaxID=1076179 RepID=A0A645G215_9ZZZZ
MNIYAVFAKKKHMTLMAEKIIVIILYVVNAETMYVQNVA